VADALEELGPVWGEFLRLSLVEDACRAREQAAATRGDLNAKAKAELDREDAQAEIQRFRERYVSGFMLALRWAIDLNPAALAEHISGAWRNEFDCLRAAIMDAEYRLDRLDVMARRAELDELKDTVKDLERRIGRMEARP
jgi:hypothetical protein